MDSLALRKAAIMVAHISYILASLLLVAGALASSLPPRRTHIYIYFIDLACIECFALFFIKSIFQKEGRQRR